MLAVSAVRNPILPRSKWWWLGLAALMLLAGWLYYRGYNVSLPYMAHVDEPIHLVAAQHIIDFGTARGMNNHDSYPPGTNRLIYLLLKHAKPPDAHHGSLLPALRLITISAWMLTVVVIALLGSLMVRPITGLMAAAIWVVNPWVVERAHWVLPDGYLTLFTLLSLWLALIGALYGKRSFSTAAVYSLMLAIVFKTSAIFAAPFILFLPLVGLRQTQLDRIQIWQQLFWNLVRFAIFLFWLLLIHPTLDALQIPAFPVKEMRINTPQLATLTDRILLPLMLQFQPISGWIGISLLAALLLRYRRQIHGLPILLVAASSLAWLLGISMFRLSSSSAGDPLRQLFVPGALLALLYAASLTGLFLAVQEALARLGFRYISTGAQRPLVTGLLAILLGLGLLPSFRVSDALTHNYTLHDRRNDLAQYMDRSLPPGKYSSTYNIRRVLLRDVGGYAGIHNFPMLQKYILLNELPIEEWRAKGVEYSIMPYNPLLENPNAYYPDETVLLKSYPPDPDFRDPGMVVLRIHPMQFSHGGQLGSTKLLGYDINSFQFAIGDEVVLRHYWQASEPAPSLHHVFNHLLNGEGDIVTQADYTPLWDNRRDTTTWDDPNEIMFGREFKLKLPALPSGTYQLISGLYDPQTWQRLTAADGADHLLIAEIEVIPAR